jgi:hypothetical protein
VLANLFSFLQITAGATAIFESLTMARLRYFANAGSNKDIHNTGNHDINLTDIPPVHSIYNRFN